MAYRRRGILSSTINDVEVRMLVFRTQKEHSGCIRRFLSVINGNELGEDDRRQAVKGHEK